MSKIIEQKKTSIASGEGKADKIFLTYLKKLYGSRQAQHHIDIPSNNNDGHTGGSSVDVVKEVMQKCFSRDYDALLFLLDGDILQYDCARLMRKAKERCRKDIRCKIPDRYKCVIAQPCLEGLLLTIYKRMSGIHLAMPVFSKGYRPKQGKAVP